MRKAFLVSLAVMCSIASVAFTQEIQTESAVLTSEEQTASITLETVLSLIQENDIPKSKLEELELLFTTVIELGLVTPEQALGLLEAVDWAELVVGENMGFAIRALELALAAIISQKAPYEEVLLLLEEIKESERLGPLASEERFLMSFIGVLKSLGEAHEMLADPRFVERIGEALASGIPPGQLVRLVKTLMREEVSEEDILAALDELTEKGKHRGASGDKKVHGKGKGSEKEEDDDTDKGKGPGKGVGKGKSPGKGKGPGKGEKKGD